MSFRQTFRRAQREKLRREQLEGLEIEDDGMELSPVMKTLMLGLAACTLGAIAVLGVLGKLPPLFPKEIFGL